MTRSDIISILALLVSVSALGWTVGWTVTRKRRKLSIKPRLNWIADFDHDLGLMMHVKIRNPRAVPITVTDWGLETVDGQGTEVTHFRDVSRKEAKTLNEGEEINELMPVHTSVKKVKGILVIESGTPFVWHETRVRGRRLLKAFWKK